MAVTRVALFLISPFEQQPDVGPGIVSTLSYATVPDANATGKSFTCAYCPPSRGSGVSVAQETMFVGTNAAGGKTLQTFKNNLALDGSAAITAEFISQRLDPENRGDSNQGRDSVSKRYDFVAMDGANLTDDGGQLYWLKDIDPATSPVVSWTEFTYTAGDRGFYFESGLGKFVHLRGVYDGMTAGQRLLSGFSLRYRLVGKSEEGKI